MATVLVWKQADCYTCCPHVRFSALQRLQLRLPLSGGQLLAQPPEQLQSEAAQAPCHSSGPFLPMQGRAGFLWISYGSFCGSMKKICCSRGRKPRATPSTAIHVLLQKYSPQYVVLTACAAADRRQKNFASLSGKKIPQTAPGHEPVPLANSCHDGATLVHRPEVF